MIKFWPFFLDSIVMWCDFSSFNWFCFLSSPHHHHRHHRHHRIRKVIDLKFYFFFIAGPNAFLIADLNSMYTCIVIDIFFFSQVGWIHFFLLQIGLPSCIDWLWRTYGCETLIDGLSGLRTFVYKNMVALYTKNHVWWIDRSLNWLDERH